MKINSINPNINSYNSVVSKWKKVKDDSVRSADSFFDEAKELLDSVKKRIGNISAHSADVLTFPENEDFNHVSPEYYLYNHKNPNEFKLKISLLV